VRTSVHRRLLLLLLIAWAVALHGVSLDQAASDWIASHAIQLDALELTGGRGDLQPLRSILGGAHVIGVGEATHGTREFFTLRLRLMDFLTAQLGVRAFAFEFPYGEAKLIDHYVQTGEGDPADVLARVYCTPWNNRETLDAIEWMRVYNEGRPESQRVSFHGVDMHDGDSNLLADAVLQYVREVDASAAEDFASHLEAFRYVSMYHAAVFTDPDGSGRATLQWVVDELAARRSTHVGATSSAQSAEILHQAELLLQRAEVFAVSASDPQAGNDLRDRYMADNVLWLLETLGRGAKIMFGAHNFHVGRFLRLPSLLGAGTVQRTSAGWHLGDQLGSGYMAVATTTVEGDVAVFPFPGGRREQYAVEALPRTPHDAHASLLQAAGIPAMLLDVRGARQGESATEWILEERPLLQIGTTLVPSMRDSYLVYTPLHPSFDVIAYVETTTPATMLPWVPKDSL